MAKKYSAELKQIAKRIIWFKPPEQALEDKVYFLCYLMQYGLPQDIIKSKKYFTPENFTYALKNAYPGILDQRSWVYWNLIYLNNPKRSAPKRQL